ncbi:MAG: VWA domain-containing protein [Desulfobacteraceae bacterium]|nr:VWA domain-containing protein [Desulfobacteraceae bacterium]
MFRFASPIFFALVIFLFLILFLKIRRKDISQLRTASLKKIDTFSPTFGVWISKVLPALKYLAVLLLITALARPQLGNQKTNVSTEGINIILALDLSESMRALDFKRDNEIVTRLDAVKGVVSDFILQRQGDRIGMVVFGSNAFTQLPLTRDYNTIAFMLEKLKIGAAGPTTAIGDAIGISLKRLEDIKAKSNIIILLTDGKSNAGQISWQDASDIAAQRGVKIYTIGVGTKGKAPYLENTIFGQRYVYKPVDVDLDALKTIAKKTNAVFYAAKDTAALKGIYDRINALEKTKVEVEKWVEYKELYPWFLITGLLLLGVQIFLVNTRFLRIP